METAVPPSLVEKKSSARKIFGSNLVLKDRRIVVAPILPTNALRAFKNFSKRQQVVSELRELYGKVRLYFTQNP
jgi:hypothetical protein